jgi:hypothetical protein
MVCERSGALARPQSAPCLLDYLCSQRGPSSVISSATNAARGFKDVRFKRDPSIASYDPFVSTRTMLSARYRTSRLRPRVSRSFGTRPDSRDRDLPGLSGRPLGGHALTHATEATSSHKDRASKVNASAQRAGARSSDDSRSGRDGPAHLWDHLATPVQLFSDHMGSKVKMVATSQLFQPAAKHAPTSQPPERSSVESEQASLVSCRSLQRSFMQAQRPALGEARSTAAALRAQQAAPHSGASIRNAAARALLMQCEDLPTVSSSDSDSAEACTHAHELPPRRATPLVHTSPPPLSIMSPPPARGGGDKDDLVVEIMPCSSGLQAPSSDAVAGRATAGNWWSGGSVTRPSSDVQPVPVFSSGSLRKAAPITAFQVRFLLVLSRWSVCGPPTCMSFDRFSLTLPVLPLRERLTSHRYLL